MWTAEKKKIKKDVSRQIWEKKKKMFSNGGKIINHGATLIGLIIPIKKKREEIHMENGRFM